MLWIGLRASVYGCVPLLVTILFGLDPARGMLLTPIFCLATARCSASPASASRWRRRSPRSTSSTTSRRSSSRRSSSSPAPSSRSTNCPRACRSWLSSTPCTSWSNWSAAAPSATRRSTCPLRRPRRLRLRHVADRGQPDGGAVDRLDDRLLIPASGRQAPRPLAEPARRRIKMDRAAAFEARPPGVSVAFGSSRARLRHPRHPLKAASFRT